jgi:hypothetical protein
MIVLWSIRLCCCNNGISTEQSVKHNSNIIHYWGWLHVPASNGPSLGHTLINARYTARYVRNTQWVPKKLSYINPVVTKNTIVFLFGLQVNIIQYTSKHYSVHGWIYENSAISVTLSTFLLVYTSELFLLDIIHNHPCKSAWDPIVW